VLFRPPELLRQSSYITTRLIPTIWLTHHVEVSQAAEEIVEAIGAGVAAVDVAAVVEESPRRRNGSPSPSSAAS